MEFRKCERNAKLFLSYEWREWRLASVEEVRSNIETIKDKQILESWDIARLLDGWVDGPAYRYTIKNEYKPNLGDMLLIKTPVSRPSDGSFNEDMYSGVELNSEGTKAALLLSCDDKITEVMSFVLKGIIERFQQRGERQIELDRLTESLNETFNHCRTVLHYAADQPHNGQHAQSVAELVLRNFEYGKELIKAADKYGRTALFLAALHGHINFCSFLMNECGLRAAEKDGKGENLLHFVVNSNKGDIVEKLCQLSPVRMLIASQDAKGKTPLHKAAATGNKVIIDALLRSMARERVSVEECIRRTDLFGQTALHEAASRGHQEAVQLLLINGSNPLTERDSEGKTALHYSVHLPNQRKAKEMAEILLQSCKSDEERSLLLWASATGIGTAEESAIPSSLVQTYLKEQRELVAGTDLLRSAIKLGHETLAWELIKRGVNTSHINNYESDLSPDEREQVDKFLKRESLRVKRVMEGGPDQPTIYDSLGRRVLAEGLAALFLNPYVKSPVTVGISGEWGMGKSSLMLQTEIILLQAAAQLAFPNILPIEDFPGQFNLTQKDRKKYNKVRDGVKDLLPPSVTDNIADPLVYILDNYQDKYLQVYKSLALMDRGEMFRLKDITSDSSGNLGKIPSILTVRYNAWHYENKLEAWAGLAVTITKVMEEAMTKSQRIRSWWRYTWKERGREILLEFFFPCFLALFLSGWLTWAVWMLLRRSKHSELEDLKYGSIPVTLVVIFWTVMRQLHSVFKPVSVQVMRYVRLPEHSTNLGYQHQVISDIDFLIEQICEKPSLFWKFLAGNWLWRMCGFYLDTVEGTSIPKSPPPSKNDLRIIVFVDDLDRCEDAVILKVLSAVNLVLAVCRINVILGMDKKMIARAIARSYQDNNNLGMEDAIDLAEKYLSKIVQLPLALPDPGNDERTQFLNQQLGEEFKESGDDETEGSSQPLSVAQSSDTESLQQGGPERLPDALPSDIENPQENIPQNHLQSSPESRPIISQVLNCLPALRSWLCGWSYSGPDRRSSKLKSTLINSHQLILPSYSDEERKAIAFLSTQTTDHPQLPREWKRFLLYHRLAWNIFLISKQGKNLPGWQVQLLVWTFCCWQWQENINRIIKNWKQLVSLNGGIVNDEEPSFKTIVENFVDRVYSNMEADEWKSLIQTLAKYDVTMESIQSFQKFRLHCEIKYLHLPPANVTEPMRNTSSLESV